MQAQGLQSLEDFADARHELALHGRYGDTTIGHLTPGEMVLPRPIADDPVLKRQLFDAFERHEINPYQYQVGHFENSINPLTGVPEFGFFKKVGKFLKKAAPVIGQVVGFMLGGPAGAAIGGGIGGAIKHGDLKGTAKEAARGYVFAKTATGFGVKGGQGLPSLWGQGGPSGTESIWQLGDAVPGTGGIGGLFQNLGASAAGMLRGKSAGLPTDYKGVGGAWGGLSGLEKMGVGALGLTAVGGLEPGRDDSQMPPPSGELGGYLQRPLTPATVPTQYGTEGMNIGQQAPLNSGITSGVGTGLDPATAAYLRSTMDNEQYSKLMFPEFQQYTGGERTEFTHGGTVSQKRRRATPEDKTYENLMKAVEAGKITPEEAANHPAVLRAERKRIEEYPGIPFDTGKGVAYIYPREEQHGGFMTSIDHPYSREYEIHSESGDPSLSGADTFLKMDISTKPVETNTPEEAQAMSDYYDRKSVADLYGEQQFNRGINSSEDFGYDSLEFEGAHPGLEVNSLVQQAMNTSPDFNREKALEQLRRMTILADEKREERDKEYAGGGRVFLSDGSQLPELDLRKSGGRISDPMGSGDKDTVNAKLADGEFVMTKQGVSGLGNGSHESGIQTLYAMMNAGENRAQQMGIGRV